MKTIYLVRHAKSSWKNSELKDIERPLNKRGKRDAPFMGQLLQQKGVTTDVMITSPAVRTQTTAKHFAEALQYPLDDIEENADIYEADVAQLFDVIHHIDNKHASAMLFGHNMTYTLFANLYAQPPLDNVPTCGIVCLQFSTSSWAEINRDNGLLLFFEYPKKYFPKKK